MLICLLRSLPVGRMPGSPAGALLRCGDQPGFTWGSLDPYTCIREVLSSHLRGALAELCSSCSAGPAWHWKKEEDEVWLHLAHSSLL